MFRRTWTMIEAILEDVELLDCVDATTEYALRHFPAKDSPHQNQTTGILSEVPVTRVYQVNITTVQRPT